METKLETNKVSNDKCTSEAACATTNAETFKHDDDLLFEELKPYKLFISDIIY
jgi:hypothetical protein